MERTPHNVEYRTEGGAITFDKVLMLEADTAQAQAEAWAAALGEHVIVTKVEAAG